MDDNFSPRVKDVITYSKEEALRLGHDFIGTEHLVLGLIRNGEGKAIDILNFLGIDLNELRRKIESLNPINFDNEVKESTKKNLHLTRQAERALAHLLLCILRNENDPTAKIFNNMEINYNVVKDEYKSIIGKDELEKMIFLTNLLKVMMDLSLKKLNLLKLQKQNLNQIKNPKHPFLIILAKISHLWLKMMN